IDRYPPGFAKFLPECHDREDRSLENAQRLLGTGHENFAAIRKARIQKLKTCGDAALVNEYDNSILYTDYFLHEVIERLTARHALMLYVSDHGESLGDEGRDL